jgi:hypothetical protein
MRLSAILLCLFAAIVEAGAAENGAKKLNPKLTAMADNTWLDLKPKGMAESRNYSGCCFGGGFFWYFGGAHKSYKGNDVDLYDPVKNEWINATKAEWPEVGSTDWKRMVSGGGSTSKLSPSGAPYTEHTYQQVCWVPERKRFFVLLVSSGTWEFDPETGKWIHLVNRFKDRSAEPRGHWAQNQVVYDPELKAPVHSVNSGGGAHFRVFDFEKKAWKRLAGVPREIKWKEWYSTYVPEWKRHLIVLGDRKKGLCFYKLDVGKGKVEALKEKPEGVKRCQALAYDSTNKVVVALPGGKPGDPWVLDVEKEKWEQLKPAGPKPSKGGGWAPLWYDADHNVFYFLSLISREMPGGKRYDGGVTRTWAYRYKKAPKQDSK